MKRTLAVVLALTLAACASGAGQGADRMGTAGGAVEAAIERVFPALVRIHVVTIDYSEGREQKYEGAGSGAIISPEGHVVTNHHVAARASLITCTLANREEVTAELIGTDALADIAVLKLRLGERRDPDAPVPVAVFGDSDDLRVGDPILAMGSPLALSQSVTRGIVSNRDLILPERFVGRMELDGENVGSLVKWIGHDAQIFPGNSGGPLVNLKGEIVGVNEIGVGLAGAIPSNLARRVVTDLIELRDVARSWTGLELQPLLKGSGRDVGVLVAGVVEDSVAEKAGLRSGDILLSWDGRSVSARFDEEIPAVNRVMLETPIGREVPVVVRRGGEDRTFTVTTQPRGKVRGDERELRSWGLTAREITAMMAAEMRREPGSGALVSSMRDGGPASDAKPPIQYGDVITSVNGKPVSNVEDLVRMTEEITKDRTKPVPTLVGFDRRREKLLTVVQVGPEPEDRSTEAKKAWFPAATQVLTAQLAESLGLAGRRGVRITQVYPGTSAEAAGLREGDLIVAIDGEKIDAHQVEHRQVFPTMVRQRKIGSRSELTVIRGKEEMKVEVELPANPAEIRELETWRDEMFDFAVREIAFKDRIDYRLPQDQQGAIVGQVESGGWASFAGLRSGDLILSIDGRVVDGVPAVKTIMEDVARRRPAFVAFQVRRGVHTMFVEIQPAWPASH